MKSNEDLQKDVQDALKWEPLLEAAEIGVIVKNGIITLTGIVDSFAKKYEAENAAKKVAGVRAVVDDITVEIGSRDYKNDVEIAADVVEALEKNVKIPSGKITVTVEGAWITLEGTVEWAYQKESADETLFNLKGIKGITNKIMLLSDVRNEAKKKLLEEALERHWALNLCNVNIEVRGSEVILSGFVYSAYEKDEVEKIIYKSPGITNVRNILKIEPAYKLQ